MTLYTVTKYMTLYRQISTCTLPTPYRCAHGTAHTALPSLTRGLRRGPNQLADATDTYNDIVMKLYM